MKLINAIKRGGIRLWNMRMQTKLLLSYTFIIVIALTVLGSYAYYQAKNQIRDNVRESMNVVLQSKCGEIENELIRCESALLNVSRNYGIYRVIEEGYKLERDGYVWENMDEVFVPTVEAALKNNYNIRRLSIYTSRDVPEVGDMLLQESRISGKSWYKEVKDSFGIHWRYSNGEFFAVCEIIDIWDKALPEKDYIGMAYLGVDSSIILDPFKTDERTNYQFGLLDVNNVLFKPDGMLNRQINFVNDKIVEIDGESYAYQIRKIEGTPWSIAVYLPHQKMYSGISEILPIAGIIILLSLLLIGFCGVLFSYAMTSNIKRLRGAMDDIGKGNLQVEIPVKSGDEIGEIAEGLKSMLETLDCTVRQLYESKIENQQQELKVLQAQINPHFLYNVLSTISWTAMEENADETAYMVELLSTFYRTSLNNGKTLTNFESELKNAKAYIAMELLIHDNSFDVEYDIDEEVYKYCCINFILQPIIENAIFYGVNSKKDDDKRGKIRLSVVLNEDIEVYVQDNGEGMSEETRRNILDGSGKGYGLRNIQKRIKLMFGKKYGIEIISDNNTTVKVLLPRLESTDEELKFPLLLDEDFPSNM